jgi:aminoglycoside 3-N-acetyltransferase
MGRAYELGGHVHSLGTVRTTILHLAEYQAEYPSKHVHKRAGAVFVNGQRKWAKYEDIEGDEGDFEQIRLGYMAEHPAGEDTWHEGNVAYGKSRLFAIGPLVDYAVSWMAEHRTITTQDDSALAAR